VTRLRAFFRPVDHPTATDTYLEIGPYRWEGWPATTLAILLICGPLYVVVLAVVVIGWLT
jgi:hypothetical protein